MYWFSPRATYVVFVDAPTPVTFKKLMEMTTAGGPLKSGSGTTFVLICTFPEKKTDSGGPSTVPAIWMTRVVLAMAGTARAEVPPHTRPPASATTSDRTSGLNDDPSVFMVRASFVWKRSIGVPSEGGV